MKAATAAGECFFNIEKFAVTFGEVEEETLKPSG